MTRQRRTTKGFSQAAQLMQTRIREGVEARGFTVLRLLTHWPEVVGADLARCCRPVEVSYGRGAVGATLVLLVRGAEAPMIQMQQALIREKVNACYGYNAITRIRITQTAPTGFAEGQAQFAPAPKPSPRAPSAAQRAQAQSHVSGVTNEALRRQLEMLGAQIISKSNGRHP